MVGPTAGRAANRGDVPALASPLTGEHGPERPAFRPTEDEPVVGTVGLGRAMVYNLVTDDHPNAHPSKFGIGRRQLLGRGICLGLSLQDSVLISLNAIVPQNQTDAHESKPEITGIINPYPFLLIDYS
jgi:hypothetical protein